MIKIIFRVFAIVIVVSAILTSNILTDTLNLQFPYYVPVSVFLGAIGGCVAGQIWINAE